MFNTSPFQLFQFNFAFLLHIFCPIIWIINIFFYETHKTIKNQSTVPNLWSRYIFWSINRKVFLFPGSQFKKIKNLKKKFGNVHYINSSVHTIILSSGKIPGWIHNYRKIAFIVNQWQCSVTSTITDLRHPKRKYPPAAPMTTAKHSHTLYVIKINISRKDTVTWSICSSVW